MTPAEAAKALSLDEVLCLRAIEKGRFSDLVRASLFQAGLVCPEGVPFGSVPGMLIRIKWGLTPAGVAVLAELAPKPELVT